MNHSQASTYRILDASSNRAVEGMRTIEEFVRFTLDDQRLATAAKELRHGLAESLKRIPRSRLLDARDTEGDVGTEIETDAEFRRGQVHDVVLAAIQRVQQSLRVLEEYGKTIDVTFAHEIESLRYRCYTFHQSVELQVLQLDRRSRLADAILYVLIGCHKSEEEFASHVRTLYSSGVDVLQLRDKSADDRTLLRRARLGAELAAQSERLFIVNDRPDIALLSGADGVHVGQEEIPTRQAREVIGSDRLVGVSTHNLQQVHEAIAGGADYIGCGPTFPGNTKSFDDFPGTDFLRDVHSSPKQRPLPAFAIGGIDHHNVSEVLATGFHRIAVSAAVTKAADPGNAAERLRELLRRED